MVEEVVEALPVQDGINLLRVRAQGADPFAGFSIPDPLSPSRDPLGLKESSSLEDGSSST